MYCATGQQKTDGFRFLAGQKAAFQIEEKARKEKVNAAKKRKASAAPEPKKKSKKS